MTGGIYLDSGGAAKSGYCVCQPPDPSGTRRWSCASDTSWPCPGGSGCGAGAGAAGAGGGTGGVGGAASGGAGVGSGGAGGGTVPGCDALPASALCSLNPTGQVAVQSMSDLVAAMVGTWLLCGHESVFAVNGGDVGLEITADNHWYKLFAAQGAATIRGAGFDEEGTWTAVDMGDHFQVDFNIFGGGSIYPAPVFASTPRAMRMNNNGVFRATYVIDPAVPVGTVRCASTPAP